MDMNQVRATVASDLAAKGIEVGNSFVQRNEMKDLGYLMRKAIRAAKQAEEMQEQEKAAARKRTREFLESACPKRRRRGSKVVAMLLMVAALLTCSLVEARGQGFAVATDEGTVLGFAEETSTQRWIVIPSTLLNGRACYFLRQLVNGELLVGYELPTADGNWLDVRIDPLVGAIVSESERTDGPLPRWAQRGELGAWFLGSSDVVACKQDNCQPSSRITVLRNDGVAVTHGPIMFATLTRAWRWSPTLSAVASTTWLQSQGSPFGPGWLNTIDLESQELAQWASPLNDDLPPGSHAPCLSLEEVAYNGASGAAWILLGSWGWKPVQVDISTTPNAYLDVPLAGENGVDLRESAQGFDAVYMAEARGPSQASLTRIEPSTFATSWKTAPTSLPLGQHQNLLITEHYVWLMCSFSGAGPVTSMFGYHPTSGVQMRSVALPSQPRYACRVLKP